MRAPATRAAIELAVCDLGANTAPDGTRRVSFASVLPNGVRVRFIVNGELAAQLGRDLVELASRLRETDPIALPSECAEGEFRIYVAPASEDLSYLRPEEPAT